MVLWCRSLSGWMFLLQLLTFSCVFLVLMSVPVQSFVTLHTSGSSHSGKSWPMNTIRIHILLTCRSHGVFSWPSVPSLFCWSSCTLIVGCWLHLLLVIPGQVLKSWGCLLSQLWYFVCIVKIPIPIFLCVFNPSRISPWASTVWKTNIQYWSFHLLKWPLFHTAGYGYHHTLSILLLLLNLI